MSLRRLLRLAFGVVVLGATVGAFAAASAPAPAMHFLYNAQQSRNDTRNDYYWSKVLRTALERTRGEYGDFDMAPAPAMSETRQLYEMQHDATQINTMVLPSRLQLERSLIPVKIPVDRGMLGFRVFLIRVEDQARFDKIDSFSALRSIRIGVGEDWVDYRILADAGLQVVGGSSYEGLFNMLIAGRFDAFSRGAAEVVHEFDERRAALPNLAIEKHLLLYYPIPAYFWFPKTADGARRAKRVQTGMTGMVADGTLQKLFLAEYGPQLARLDLKHRRIIRIRNSQLDADEPLANRALWYDPVGK